MLDRLIHRFRTMSPGMALFLLGPVLGELVSGHQGPFEFINPILFLLTSLPYGCGALICRELTVRWRKGWPSLMLLALAYGLYEEAIVVRSVFDPQWEELGALADYNYWKGLNWTYSQMLIHFHVTITIMASVTLAHVLYPAQRAEPWLTGKQLKWCFVGLGWWMPAGWAMTMYHPPPVGYLLALAAIVALIVLAWRIPRQPFARRITQIARVPRPRRFMIVGALNMFAVFIIVFMVPEADTRPPLWVSWALVMAAEVIAIALIVRWSGAGERWDDRHRLALIVGQLSFFLLFGYLTDLEEGFAARSLTSTVAIYLFWRLGRRINSEATPAEAVPAASG